MFLQARDGGLLEEVQREEEAEGSHLDHDACLEELLKYVPIIVNYPIYLHCFTGCMSVSAALYIILTKISQVFFSVIFEILINTN